MPTNLLTTSKPALADVLPDPDRLPFGWKQVLSRNDRAVYNEIITSMETIGGKMTMRPGLGVTVHAPELKDGQPWVRITVARPHAWPNYRDLMDVKRVFLGGERYATVLLKKDSEALEEHKYQVTLWASVSGDSRTTISPAKTL